MESNVCHAVWKTIFGNSQAAAARFQYLLSIYSSAIKQNENITKNLFSSEMNGGISFDKTRFATLAEQEIIRRVVTSVLKFPTILISKHNLSKKIVYICACLALQFLAFDDNFVTLVRDALEWLQLASKVDLSHELSLCLNTAVVGESSTSITNQRDICNQPRTGPELLAQGAKEVFEVCNVCAESIGWLDLHTGRCANNHLFGKCPNLCLSCTASY